MPKFAAGQSGNPSGRRPGIPNKLTLEARRLLEVHVSGVLQATVDSALSGDSRAQRIILGLALPKRIRAPIDLPSPDNETNVSVSIGVVIEALAKGSIEADEARTLAFLLDTASRNTEAEGRMTKFFDTVLETVAAESPDVALRITARLTKMQTWVKPLPEKNL